VRVTKQEAFLREYGFPWLPWSITAVARPADMAMPKPAGQATVDEIRNVRE
jgi:hypothetical protein